MFELGEALVEQGPAGAGIALLVSQTRLEKPARRLPGQRLRMTRIGLECIFYDRHAPPKRIEIAIVAGEKEIPDPIVGRVR